ncbi:MAG: FecR domain-containing protein [Candidatus Pseudobacter hemicellulosilyticus]|uniref:FecR domain-containing protein n=1 Tax=Candidatus Pseudobacter hemicellulosilyticus TaxID=3121375 RepID=A0AAJ6BFL5_9BACT|nr:MAG: FecR domain-containing protein [Pseudobacter sp.]
MTPLAELLQLATRRDLTGQERQALILALRASAQEEAGAWIAESIAETTAETPIEPELAAAMLANILEEGRAAGPAIQPHPVRRLFTGSKWWAAAAVVLTLGIGGWLWTISNRSLSSANTAQPMDVAPGSNGAILTLADGSKLVLDSLGNGLVAMQNGARLLLKNGQLAYKPGGVAGNEAVYNMMSTPKGRQFNLVLPDGTRVWLNSASTLRYPTTFSGSERRVHITGEAYFEVAKNSKLPFRVTINDRVEAAVLGTSFNVNAYENEASIDATLIEGSIAVAATAEQPVILKPAQQARIIRPSTAGNQSGTKVVVQEAAIEQVVAWKNGVFDFENMGLEEAMRQLERWYDIEVVYEEGIPRIFFTGKMSKDISLNGLLKLLEEAKVHFRLEEGRRLVVLP